MTTSSPLPLFVLYLKYFFAVDSIPAVIGVSQDLLIVYSSNIFAIMGLRSLYTLVARAVQDLPYLRPAVALVLAFIGLKMILEFFHYHLSIGLSLSVVAALLTGGIVLSLIQKRRQSRKARLDPPDGDPTESSAVSELFDLDWE